MSDYTYRIVCCDNFGRSGEQPGFDEVFFGNIESTDRQELLLQCKELNSIGGLNGPDFYRVVPSDYKLGVFQP